MSKHVKTYEILSELSHGVGDIDWEEEDARYHACPFAPERVFMLDARGGHAQYLITADNRTAIRVSELRRREEDR